MGQIGPHRADPGALGWQLSRVEDFPGVENLKKVPILFAIRSNEGYLSAGPPPQAPPEPTTIYPGILL
jgi:hypothetical protein